MMPSLIRALLAVLAAALAAHAEPQVLIQSPRVIVHTGAPHPFQAAVLEPPPDPTLVWSLETPAGGTIDPATGVFRATAEEVLAKGVLRFTVHAALRSDPGIEDTFVLQVVSPMIEKLLGPEVMALLADHSPDWIDPWLKGHPFNEPETAKLSPMAKPFVDVRNEPLVFLGPDDQEVVVPAGGMPVAYRSTLTLRVPQGPTGSRTLVSLGTPGDTWATVPVTGHKTLRFQVERPITRIRMQTSTPVIGGGGFTTVQREAEVRVMGVLPLAGQPGVPGDRDGAGLAATFRAPSGMALVQAQGEPWAAAVCDIGSHAVRRVTSRGRVTTLAGLAGTPGSTDGPAADARFFSPTFLAVGTVPGGGERIFVSDSGNNTIRLIQDGIVSTYAGRADAPAGHQDAPDARAARFDRPLGLALDPEGNLYVADSHNFVIRRIDARPPHAVTTLAGQAHERGAVDGRRQDSRFWSPKGLCRVHGSLYLTDGHSFRMISLGTGQVTTLLGIANQAGFRNEVREYGLGQSPTPAFSAPWSIQPWSDGFLVADPGNHAIRLVFFLHEDKKAYILLNTLAGDPKLTSTRYGCARSGDAPPADTLQNGFAGFAMPRTALALPGSTIADLSVLIADDTAVSLGSRINLDTGGRAPAFQALPATLALGEELPVTFQVSTESKEPPSPPPLALRWSLGLATGMERRILASGFDWPGDGSMGLTLVPKVLGTFDLSLSVLAEDGYFRTVHHRFEVTAAGTVDRDAPRTRATEHPPAPVPDDLPAGPPPAPQPQAPAQGLAERKEASAPSRPKKVKKKKRKNKKAILEELKVERKEEPAPAKQEPGLPAPALDEDPRPFQLVEVRNPGRKNLSLQNFNLGAVARAHITELHVRGDQRFKSQFLAAYATTDALRAFLAEALRHRIRETPVTDSDRTEFLCRMDEPVGTVTYLDGRIAPTRNLLVVARWDQRWEVITAYPVP
jgi:hypothetical protein